MTQLSAILLSFCFLRLAITSPAIELEDVQYLDKEVRVRPKRRWKRTLQHNTTQHNTTQHNTTQHNTTQFITAIYDVLTQYSSTVARLLLLRFPQITRKPVWYYIYCSLWHTSHQYTLQPVTHITSIYTVACDIYHINIYRSLWHISRQYKL